MSILKNLNVHTIEIRNKDDLKDIDGLIIPVIESISTL
ncbi:hypothetical protein K0040_17655 [Terrisporobacter petrolearius]|nr:hypothetical protein [Terrisporobacter petrolearius]